MIGLYRFILFIFSAPISLYLLIRRWKGKEDKQRFGERKGIASVIRPSGKLFWFHAASIGESMSVLNLIESVLAAYKDINVLVTTGTVTSAELMKKKLNKKCIHQYVPVDKISSVKAFIEHWHPQVAFWVESELWPNMVYETKKSGATLFLVNARVSNESYRKWNLFKPMAATLLNCFSLCLAQSDLDRERLERLGAKNVKYTGNLKYDAPRLVSDAKELAKLTYAIGEREVFLAASTHEGEEKIIAETHIKLKNVQKDLLTIIVPRHPNREKIKSSLSNTGLNISLRSLKEGISEATDIYIADTVGELGIFYRLSHVVFMGGSFVKHGGQNPLEAIRLECAVISGPYNFNFQEIYRELEEKKAAIVIDKQEKLALIVSRLFGDEELKNMLSQNGIEFLKHNAGVAEKFLHEIKKLVQG